MIKWRKYQKETFNLVIDNFDKYDNIIVEAPTGFGKSVVNYLIARQFNSAWYATPQLVLLDQLDNDWMINKLGGITIIKGKQNYKCLIKNVTIDQAPCMMERNYKCPVRYKCPWEIAKKQALSSKITGLSFSMLLLTAGLEGWGKRELLIVDEADDMESWAVDHLGSIRFKTPVKITDMSGLTRWAYWRLNKVKAEISKLEGRQSKTSIVRMKQLKDMKRKLEFFLGDAVDNPNNWTFRQRGQFIDIKVLNAGYILKKFVWWRGMKRLITSATILDAEKFSKYNGLSGKTLFIRVPHVIPPERRPVIYIPVEKMTRDNRDEKTYKEIADTIEEIAKNHYGQNGIIHAHSYSIAKEIEKRLKLEGFKVIVHDSKNRSKKFDQFLGSRGAVFIAVGFGRGIDLKYDLARWQVITKIPYPDLSDIRVYDIWMKRKQWGWARYQAEKTLIQTVGRITRAPDDFGVTYILDKSFDGLLRYKKELPDWFLEAVRRDDTYYATDIDPKDYKKD